MKVYKGVSASPGLVLGQVSRLEHHVETFSHGPFNPERELRLLANAVHTAQNELDSMAERAAPTEQAIFLFQSMMLDDEGMMNEVRFCINAGISASAAASSGASWASFIRASSKAASAVRVTGYFSRTSFCTASKAARKASASALLSAPLSTA